MRHIPVAERNPDTLLEAGTEPTLCHDCGYSGPISEFVRETKWKAKPGPYNLEQHPEHAAALGMVVSAWSGVEYMLFIAMTFLLRTDPWQTQTVFYAIVNNNARVDVMRALAATMVGANQFGEQLAELLDRTKSLSDRRSGYVHKQWVLGIDENDVYLIENIGKPLKSEPRKIQVPELQKVAQDITKLSEDWSNFAGAYSAAHPVFTQFAGLNVHPALQEKFLTPRGYRRPGSDPRQS